MSEMVQRISVQKSSICFWEGSGGSTRTFFQVQVLDESKVASKVFQV